LANRSRRAEVWCSSCNCSTPTTTRSRAAWTRSRFSQTQIRPRRPRQRNHHQEEPLAGLAQGQPLRKQIEQGATAIAFAPNNQELAKLFPDAFYADPIPREPRTTYVEFADFSPCARTKLAENLQPMDLKWWARKGDWRVYIGHSSERLRPDGPGRELIRYIPPHSYIAVEKLPEQYRTVLCEVPIGKGRLWICNLDLDVSQDLDPAARIFADNLYRAAADPDSTKNLPKIPSHEELLKGK